MFPVEITRTGPRRLVGLTHHGAYHRIGETIGRLHPLMKGKTTVICACHDDPARTPEAFVQSFAGLGCAVLHHTGPYETIPAASAYLKHWTQNPTQTPACEVYRSTYPDAPKTDIFWPLA